MSINRVRALVVVFLVVLLPNIASAFYAAHMGRWTSRDPRADRIGGPQFAMEGTFLSRDMHSSDNDMLLAPTTYWKSGSEYNGDTNLYQYADGSPLVRLDPYGEATQKGKIPYDHCQLAFAECHNKGKAGEKLVCKFRCYCPGDHEPVEEAIELRGECQRPPNENNEKVCMKYIRDMQKRGDCACP